MIDVTTILQEFRSHFPIALGFRIVSEYASCGEWSTRPYRGTDRRLWPTDERLLMLPDAAPSVVSPKEREKIALWNEYMACDDDRRLHRDAALVVELATRFQEAGVGTEVIYFEVEEAPYTLTNTRAPLWCEQLLRMRPYLLGIGDLSPHPADLEPIGFDIGHPDGRHSAIRNPGLHRVRPEFPKHLNEYSLFPSCELASRFLDSANSLDYGVLPFCVLAIWTLPTRLKPAGTDAGPR